MGRIGLNLALGLLALGLGGCSSSDPTPAEPSTTEDVLILGYEGGRCADGGICSESWSVSPAGETTEGYLLDPEELEAAIRNSSLRELKPTDGLSCPSAYDGRDLTIEVPAWGQDVFKPCELEGSEDDPLVVLAERTLDRLRAS